MLIKRLATGLSVFILTFVSVSSLNAGIAQATPNYVEGTDPGAIVYNPLQVSKISLQMSDRDYNSLRWPNVSWDNEGDWLPTQMVFTIGTTNYGPFNVGVHLKGAWGSWRDISGKAAFKIKMDAFVEDQTFLGITKMTLNNMVQDQSYIHEVLTYRLFRAVGVPAPRTGFADVTLNGVDYGLHLNIETINPEMLKRWNISSSQMVKGAVPTFPDFWRGSEGSFAIESGIKDSYASLTAFIEANQLDGSAWWTRINQIADMKEMTLEWATELYTGHWDGYVLNRNNYFVNFDDDGKATMLPWGTDQTWNGTYNYFGANGLMVNKCFASTQCYEMYLQALAKVANTAKSLDLPSMATYVGSATQIAVDKDPFGPGLSYATTVQGWAAQQTRSQQETLTSLTDPWDTSLSQVKVNGSIYKPEQTINLAPGTKSITLTADTSRAGATAFIALPESLKPGVNDVWIDVRSKDGSHTATHKIHLYVFTDRANIAKIGFSSAKPIMTAAGANIAKALAGKFKGGQGLVLNFTMSKNQTGAKAKLDQRAAVFVTLLKLQGITPSKVIKSLTSSGSTQTLTVSAKYIN